MEPPSWDSDMKIEDVRAPRWSSGCASWYPPFVLLRPSLWLLWPALTRLAGFTFKPKALVDPQQSWDPFWIQLAYPTM
jgi:hypothetical protein